MDTKNLIRKLLDRVEIGNVISLELVVNEERVSISEAFSAISTLLKRNLIEECGDGEFKKVGLALEDTISPLKATNVSRISNEELKQKVFDINMNITLIYILEFIIKHDNATTKEEIVMQYGEMMTAKGLNSGITLGLINADDESKISSTINEEQLDKLREWYKKRCKG